MEEIFPQHRSVIERLFEDLTDQDLVKMADNLKALGYKANELHDSTESEVK